MPELSAIRAWRLGGCGGDRVLVKQACLWSLFSSDTRPHFSAKHQWSSGSSNVFQAIDLSDIKSKMPNLMSHLNVNQTKQTHIDYIDKE